jgi:exopolysaccharide biosynthesis polyprenyl glycosylphosphotransferase
VVNPVAKRVLILGTGSTAAVLIQEIESAREPSFVVAGVIDAARPQAGALADRWLGSFDELAEIVQLSRPTHIVLACDDRRASLPLDALLQCRVRGVLVEDALDFSERLTGTVAIEAVSPSRLVVSKGFRNGGAAAALARAVSLMVAAVGLVVFAPVMAIVAVAVKLQSDGPVLFVAHRAGLNGRSFRLLKFRTMRPSDGPRSEWEQDNQDRVTRLGRWLRRCHLDELPQLVNVLRGDMNLVGPRPHPSCNTQMFQDRIPFYGLRSAVLPGITGWAQVRYGYANTLEEESEKMRYDLYYIKNRSLWLDARIVVETIGLVLWRGGATQVRSQAGWAHLASSSKARRSIEGAVPVVVWNATGTASIGRS